MKKHRKNKPAPPPGLPPEEKPPVKEQPKKQPFLKRLLFGEETPDLSELEAGSTTILDILSPTSVDTKSRDYILSPLTGTQTVTPIEGAALSAPSFWFLHVMPGIE